MEQHLLNNKREAVLLGAKISFALIAVALVVGICYTIGICSITTDKTSFLANTFFLASYILLVVSIVCSGMGIDQIRHDLFINKFDLKSTKNYFDYQSTTLLNSLLFFFWGILIYAQI